MDLCSPDGYDCAQIRAGLSNSGEPDWEYVARELAKKDVTLAILWAEYNKNHADDRPYQYTWFCVRFRAWQKRSAVTMRQDHKLGEKMFRVDPICRSPSKCLADFSFFQDLSLVGLFVFNGGPVAQGGVQSVPVVVGLEESEYLCPRLVS